MNTTPEWITEVKDDEVFVFGSNIGGRHGRGAAKMALKFGAIYGQGFGMAGRTFAIPTMDVQIRKKLSLRHISVYVHKLLDFVEKRPGLKFYVTEIGCGLAGWTVKDIAPLFRDGVSLPNLYLPKAFWRVLSHDKELI